MMKIHAEPSGGRGAGSGRRGRESMSAYYRRVGTSRMGGNRRTRGVPATITPVARRRG